MSDDMNAMMGPPPAASPAGAINAFRAGQAPAAPQPATEAAIAGLSAAQRAAAARQAEILGVVGQGLSGRPYGERRALLAHMAPQLAAAGLPARAVAEFDPTDDNLAAAVSQLAAMRALLTS
jgi:hypothetical protein